MIASIEFIDHNQHIKYLYFEDKHDETTPQDIWADIKQAINELKNKVWEDEYTDGLTINNLYNRILCFDEYDRTTSIGTPTKFDETYECFLTFTDDYILFEIKIPDTFDYNDERPASLTKLKELYIINDSFTGNCVDDFIKRGVESRLTIINDLIKDIKSRVNERLNTLEYHQTGCYEKDFGDISLIKYQAQKIVDNCNKHLEQIAEKYTKL